MKRTGFIVIILFLILSTTISDNSIAYGEKIKNSDTVKWGFMDVSGNKFIKPVFDKVLLFIMGLPKWKLDMFGDI